MSKQFRRVQMTLPSGVVAFAYEEAEAPDEEIVLVELHDDAGPALRVLTTERREYRSPTRGDES